ncbi:phospholipase DDHD2 isoform X2 [Photinus pyralis]|uniref:phospholipase DDHD2 isoform X2 n=1 Tax=Photinus pyralis TaxID=7054 RepID=UPI0012671F31|nr:phospholipase DDHD2 isoform X2 [Photinus pyralis]
MPRRHIPEIDVCRCPSVLSSEAQNPIDHQQYQTTPIFNQIPPPSTAGVPATLVSNDQIVGPPPTGQSSNLYRRSTTKKVAYAQIPGLVSSQQQSYISDQTLPLQPPQNIEQSPSLINYFQTVPKVPENLSTPSGPLISETASATLPELNTHPFLPTLGAQLMPTISTDLGGQYGQSLSNFSATTSFYGNDIPSSQNTTGMTPQIYRPVYHHWFYKHTVSGESTWTPFSMPDSLALEEAFTSTDLSPETIVATDGNRYDVNVLRRERYAVYWEAAPSEVRRCSWFSKTNIDSKFIPYEENVAALLEEEYRIAFERNEWNRFVTIPNSETVLFQGPDTLVRLPPSPVTDNWGSTSSSPAHYGVLKRTMDEFDIDEGEPAEIDHLFFVVHGIGPWCDFKFRSVQEVVDDFRSIALKLMSSHFHSSRACNRVEILPISWHESVHSEETGVDQLLRNITLESIPRLRDFTNNTLLDILFYTTHIYSQAIITSVSTDLNRLYHLFQLRNPTFKGDVSLIGHSLGSLILFDILSHEIAHSEDDMTPQVVERILDEEEEDLVPELKPMNKKTLSRRISNMLLEAGAQPAKLIYPHLNFHPSALYALGSPIGVFMTVRGLDTFGPDFALPTCSYFYNVFHPYDPVAYRIEPLINQELTSLKPATVPHHMGRKRMHLEIRETFQKMGANIKERVVGSVVSAFRRFYPGIIEGSMEATEEEVVNSSAPESGRESGTSTPGKEDPNLSFGILNAGNRIDYALQESPLEVINEYIFAVGSHLCYWNSEDTVLFILTKTYEGMGISPSSPSQE